MRHQFLGLICISLCCALSGCDSGGSAPADKGKAEPAPAAATSQVIETETSAQNGSSENLVLVSLNVPNMT